MTLDFIGQSYSVKYCAILVNEELTPSEKAGYLLAVSRVDPDVKELTIEDAREIVTAYMNRNRAVSSSR